MSTPSKGPPPEPRKGRPSTFKVGQQVTWRGSVWTVSATNPHWTWLTKAEGQPPRSVRTSHLMSDNSR